MCIRDSLLGVGKVPCTLLSFCLVSQRKLKNSTSWVFRTLHQTFIEQNICETLLLMGLLLQWWKKKWKEWMRCVPRARRDFLEKCGAARRGSAETPHKLGEEALWEKLPIQSLCELQSYLFEPRDTQTHHRIEFATREENGAVGNRFLFPFSRPCVDQTLAKISACRNRIHT